MFNPVAPHGYPLPNVYLFMADIANPDLFVCVCRTWICLDITRFYEEQRLSSSGSAWPACQNRGRDGSTQFAQQFVTAPPLVACVVWNQVVSGRHLHFRVVYVLLIDECYIQGNTYDTSDGLHTPIPFSSRLHIIPSWPPCFLGGTL